MYNVWLRTWTQCQRLIQHLDIWPSNSLQLTEVRFFPTPRKCLIFYRVCSEPITDCRPAYGLASILLLVDKKLRPRSSNVLAEGLVDSSTDALLQVVPRFFPVENLDCGPVVVCATWFVFVVCRVSEVVAFGLELRLWVVPQKNGLVYRRKGFEHFLVAHEVCSAGRRLHPTGSLQFWQTRLAFDLFAEEVHF